MHTHLGTCPIAVKCSLGIDNILLHIFLQEFNRDYVGISLYSYTQWQLCEVVCIWVSQNQQTFHCYKWP